MLECIICGAESVHLPIYEALQNNKNAVIKYAVERKKINLRGWARVSAMYKTRGQSKDDYLVYNVSRRINVKPRDESSDEGSLNEDNGKEKVRF